MDLARFDSATIAHARSMDLDDWGLPKGVEIEGEPRLKGRILWRADDGRQLIGVQRCDPCTMRGTHLGELAVIAEGRLTVRQEGLADRKVGVGDALIYEEGTTDEWVVHEPLCKVFFLHAREPIEF